MCSFSIFIETSKQVKHRFTTSSRGKASWSKNKFGLVSKKVHIFYKFNIIWFLKFYSILSSLNEKLIFALRRRVSNNHTFRSMPPGLHKGSHSKGIKWRALHVIFWLDLVRFDDGNPFCSFEWRAKKPICYCKKH